MQPCKFFMVNRCLKGDDCPFSHSLDTFPCKFWHTRGHCLDGSNCRFSHGVSNSISNSNSRTIVHPRVWSIQMCKLICGELWDLVYMPLIMQAVNFLYLLFYFWFWASDYPSLRVDAAFNRRPTPKPRQANGTWRQGAAECARDSRRLQQARRCRFWVHADYEQLSFWAFGLGCESMSTIEPRHTKLCINKHGSLPQLTDYR